MRFPLILFFLIYTYSTNAQKKHFYGELNDELGQPISDAYVINYRNYHHVTSKQDGSFRIWVLPGDSLCVSHIAYKRTIVHAADKDSIIILPWETHTISPLYTEKTDTFVPVLTWEFTYDSTNYHTQTHINTYAPGSNEVGFGLNLFEAFSAIKKIGKRRKEKKQKRLQDYRFTYRAFLKDSLWRVGDLYLLSKLDSIVENRSYKYLKKHCRD